MTDSLPEPIREHPFTDEAMTWLSEKWPTGRQRCETWHELNEEGKAGITRFMCTDYDGALYKTEPEDRSSGLTPYQIAHREFINKGIDLDLIGLEPLKPGACFDWQDREAKYTQEDLEKLGFDMIGAPRDLGWFPHDDFKDGMAAAMLDVEVHRPAHYTAGGIEAIDVIEAKLTPEEFRGYCKGSSLKYLMRANFKGKEEQDRAKAEFYLQRINGQA